MLNPKTAYQFEKRIKLYTDYFEHLTKVEYYPHAGQVPVVKRYLDWTNPVKKIFAQCSRNFGKSTMSGICAVAKAGFYPRSKIYIIAPYLSLAKEIYAESNMLSDMFPPDWLLKGDRGFNRTELRYILQNGSYIKLAGADYEPSVRGIKPTDLFADEFQDWKKEVWEAMEPNLLAHAAPTLISGTPPDVEGLYTEEAQYVKDMMDSGDDRYLWILRTIYDNPRYNEDDVEAIKLRLLSKGDEAIWIREYLAEFKPGGGGAIFSVFSRYDNVMTRDAMKYAIAKAGSRCQCYNIYDPSGSRFAVSGFIWDTSTNNHYWCWSIVETDSRLLSARQLHERIKVLQEDWYDGIGEPISIYDEAAKLFAIEMEALGVPMSPTRKGINEKNNNISLGKDAFLQRKMHICDENEVAIKEIEEYRRDSKGKIIKKNDDCVDTYLYYLAEIIEDIDDVEAVLKQPDRERSTPRQDWYDDRNLYQPLRVSQLMR